MLNGRLCHRTTEKIKQRKNEIDEEHRTQAERDEANVYEIKNSSHLDGYLLRGVILSAIIYPRYDLRFWFAARDACVCAPRRPATKSSGSINRGRTVGLECDAIHCAELNRWACKISFVFLVDEKKGEICALLGSLNRCLIAEN